MNNILFAVLLLGGVAAIAATGLVFAAKFMYVPADPKREEILDVLPGANCGSCGFAGCADYAAAVADGKAEPNLCVPGQDAVAQKVAAIVGAEVKDVVEMVACVTCRGCTSEDTRFDYSGLPSCAALAMYHAGPNACAYGCLGQGDCAAVCPFDAICVTQGVAVINPDRCKGCGKCVAVCPKHIIRLMPQVSANVVLCANTDKGAVARKSCTNACIGCMKCEKNCPTGAVKVENNLAHIDESACIACGTCESACPTGAIKIAFDRHTIRSEAPAKKD